MLRNRRHWTRWTTALGLTAIVLALVGFTAAPWPSYGQPPAGGPAVDRPQPDLRIVASEEGAIVIELRVPAWEVSTKTVGSLKFDEISVPGFSYTSEPGSPRVPAVFVTLGIPPDVSPQVQVLETDGPRIERGYRLVANPRPTLGFDPAIPLSPAPLAPQNWGEKGGGALTGPPKPRGGALTGPPKPRVELARGDDFYPTELVQVVEVGRLRSQPFVQIRLSPFQYHPGERLLHAYTRLRVAVTFDKSTASATTDEPVDEGPFESLLRSLLLNYQQGKAWRVPPRAASRAHSEDFYAGIRYRIEVSQNGIYQLDRSLLSEADLGDYPLSTFQLFEDFNLSAESEVALEIVDQDGDDRFDAADVIRFYGRAAAEEEQRYTSTRVYWLTVGRGPGARMATRSAPPGSGTTPPNFPTTVHTEENHTYYSDLPEQGGSDAHWYWSYLVHVDPASPLQRDFAVSTPDISSTDHKVTLRAKLVSYSSNPAVAPDHHVKLYLVSTVQNADLPGEREAPATTSYPVADVTWDGQRGILIEAPNIPSSWLTSGDSTVRLEIELLPGVIADALYVDWFEVDYLRAFRARDDRLTFPAIAGYSEYRVTGFSPGTVVGVYDITDPRRPVRLIGTQTTWWGWLLFNDATPGVERYAATALQRPALLTPDNVARVGAGDDLRAPGIGAEYVIITHADFTAAANRLAAHRATDLTARVVQVQDVYNQFGNAVLDPEAIYDFLVYAYDNWSPRPRYVLLMGDGHYDYRDYLGGPRQNFIPPYLAMVDPWLGETADENYFAAVSGSDIVPDLFVGRLPVNTLDEANAVVDKIISYEGATSLTGLQATPEKALFVADDFEPGRNAGNFPRLADDIAVETLPASYEVQKVYYGETHTTVEEVRSAIVSHINQGERFVNYIGHASVGQWADEGFLTSFDVDGLSNAGQFPVVLGMTCLEGSFHNVAQDAVAERLVRAVNKGAIASWSATGLGVATGHDELSRGFYNALFQNGVRRLGPAAVAGKVRVFNTGANLDLIHTFALLGDPAADTGITAPCTQPEADIIKDGTIDVNDLAELSLYWRQSYVPYDQNGDGFINIVDLMLVATAWGSDCGG